jgi:competence protein ComFC
MTRIAQDLLGRAARLARPGLTLLFPPRCACCNAELAPKDGKLELCGQCQTLLGPENWIACPRCGAVGEKLLSNSGCRRCRATKLKTDGIVVLGGYAGELRSTVLRMKRPGNDFLSASMGWFLVDRRREQLAAVNADFVVPVPMFWTRRLVRGTNSPEIIARSVAASLGLKVRGKVLARCRNTLPQADLPPRQRLSNVRGAFRSRESRHLDGARVLLIDDILTTGATCSEAARMLKQAGASVVVAVVVAKTALQGSR